MTIKKSDLYSSLWPSCDQLHGGMDASQYKDYVLFMLFIKYSSDKYADNDDFAPPVVIPPGASFKDMVALKGNLPSVPAASVPANTAAEPEAVFGDECLEQALKLDKAIREEAPAGWKGDSAREAQVLNAIYPIMKKNKAATQAIFEIIKNQPGY